MTKRLLFVILLTMLLYTGCIQRVAETPTPSQVETPATTETLTSTSTPDEKEPTPLEELELRLVETAPPSYRLEVSPLFVDGGLCFAGSLAVLAKYTDSSVEPEDIIGYGGLGPIGYYSSEQQKFVIRGQNLAPSTIALAARNLGFDIIMGIAKDGRIDGTTTDGINITLESQANNITYYYSDDEAFDFLKRVIASGYPVAVHLNIIEVMSDFASISNDWVKRMKSFSSLPNKSEFMVVTGYDEANVYLIDPIDPGKPTNLLTRTDNFLAAWNVPKNMVGSNVGPYWMIYITKSGDRKQVNDILTWNKQRSVNVPSDIRLWAEQATDETVNTFTSQDFAHISAARSIYAKFLDKNGRHESAFSYEQSSKLWEGLSKSLNLSDDLREIADLEEQAQGLY
ncbi:MAG: hypothetical protein V1932_00210 [Chloroflexota bacterium]